MRWSTTVPVHPAAAFLDGIFIVPGSRPQRFGRTLDLNGRTADPGEGIHIMRASVRAALLVSGAAALALGVAPALAAPLAGPAPVGGWSVAEGPRDGEGKIRTCPEAGSDGMHDMSWSAMASTHRAHHRDRAGGPEAMAGMHRAHHRDRVPDSMMGGRPGDMMGGRDTDDPMGPGHMGR